MSIIIELHIFELVYLQNLTQENYLKILDYIFRKRLFQVWRRKNEHRYWIVYI